MRRGWKSDLDRVAWPYLAAENYNTHDPGLADQRPGLVATEHGTE